VKGQVVDGEGVTNLYSRLRKKHSVLFNRYQNRYHYVWKHTNYWCCLQVYMCIYVCV